MHHCYAAFKTADSQWRREKSEADLAFCHSVVQCWGMKMMNVTTEMKMANGDDEYGEDCDDYEDYEDDE